MTANPKKNKPMKKFNKGDANESSAGKGDRLTEVNIEKFDENFDIINWSKGRKKDSEKKHRVAYKKESDREFNRRCATP